MFLFLLIHGLGLLASLKLGGLATGMVLQSLRLENRDDTPPPSTPVRPGARGAGEIIGYAERFVLYMAVVAQQPALIAVLFGLKTWVRYPEVQRSATPREDGLGTGRFAEYYLVGTLVSMAFGLAVPLLATGLLAALQGP